MPYFRFTRESNEQAEQIVARLAPHVSARKWFRWKAPDSDFEGTVSLTGFSINKVVRGRDSFNPLILGKFVTVPSGTRVTIEMFLHPLVIGFCCFLTFLMAPEAWKALKAMPDGDRGTVVMVAILWGVTLVFFYYNAFRLKKSLIRRLALNDYHDVRA